MLLCYLTLWLTMNRLASERSAYLKHASHQKIDWHPWSDEAFERARSEGKPVFLSTGAVWCHWCHVMAKESFEDEAIAELMNEWFVSIKLDRDERPDIDRRYQQVVAALGGGSGWPLSVFLTPDKKPFFGGTYFPPDDLQGRPGFRKVLTQVSAYYQANRERAEDLAARVMDALRPEAASPGDIGPTLLEDAEHAMLALVDMQNGGFGSAPKFPMPGALEFILRRVSGGGAVPARNAAIGMLDAMSRGGLHDHLGGGFHRYSVDEAWIVPHFEKMADDNAGLLRNYLDGYAVFGDEQYRGVALGIIAFTREVLSDPTGGFYASQDADVTPDDEGGYFTWTEDDFRRTLDSEEYPILSLLYLHDRGSMHHDPAKKVLFIERAGRELAERFGRSMDDILTLIRSGNTKLLSERGQRQEPFIDRALYTSLNGMLISAWFHAFAVLGEDEVRAFAVRSLERILRERLIEGNLYHTEGVPGLLDDYIHLVDALIGAYEASADRKYVESADALMQSCLDQFYDSGRGGFFDTAGEVLGLRLKRIEDVPHPSANASAIMQLLKLGRILGREDYQHKAEQSLKEFVAQARDMTVHAGAYFCALDAFFRMLTLTIEAPVDSELARAARALSGSVPVAILYGEDKGRVIPCCNGVCYEPIHEASGFAAYRSGGKP